MKYEDLNIKDRAAIIKIGVLNGLTSLSDIKLLYNMYAEGGSIHIKPENKGKFTAAAKSRGMGVLEFASKVLANKENYSPTLVKRANFARNASKWKYLEGGYLFEEGGLKNSYYNTNNTHQLNWPALLSVPHHIVADTNWVNENGEPNYIETFVPNLLHKIWPQEDVTKGYYANNPYPRENTSLYNPNDKSVVDDTITLDGLHYMHDNPTYETLYQDLEQALTKEPQALFEALIDLTGDEKLSRGITDKAVKGEKLTSEDLEYYYPAIDGYLRRQFAPDYMRNIPRGYDVKYPMKGDLKKTTDAIESIMETYILPEIVVTPNNNTKSTGGPLYPFSFGKQIPQVRY